MGEPRVMVRILVTGNIELRERGYGHFKTGAVVSLTKWAAEKAIGRGQAEEIENGTRTDDEQTAEESDQAYQTAATAYLGRPLQRAGDGSPW